MKIIVSHDIDHINFTEHYKDLIIPKYIARAGLELVKGKIGFKECCIRLFNLFKIRFNRVKELSAFNEKYQVNETYFMGVNNGLGLSYSQKKMKQMAKYLSQKGLDFGVHGIDYDHLEGIQKEYDDFENLTGRSKFGIRMHYLRKDDHTISRLADVGYKFDATEIGLKPPYKQGDMWEFPVQLMDAYLLCGDRPMQIRTLAEVKQITIDTLKEAEALGLPYFSLLFHDIYFDNGFKTWKDWYTWVIEYLVENQYEFISFEDAMIELEQNK